MKKIILGGILTIILSFSIIFLKPIKTHAEDVPNLFLMNEIYLYDYESFTFDPNFNDDYLLKATILPSDINNNIGAYLGWFKNLGYDNLLIPYYGDDVDNDKTGYMAIPLDGVLGANFQLGYIATSPYAIQFGMNFTDGTTQLWDTETNGYGAQILTISQSNLTKAIKSFWWEYKTADYVPSFKFLGVTDGYDLGYQNGLLDGNDQGWQLGYNLGFRDGFNDGITQSDDVVIYENLLNFNQLVKNPNFSDNSNWSTSGGGLNVDNNVGRYASNNISALYTNLGAIPNGHKILYRITYNTNELNMNLGIYKNSSGYNYFSPVSINEYNTTWRIATIDSITTDTFDLRIRFNSAVSGQTIYLKNILVVDLTQMFGSGLEPNLEESRQIFTSDYYEYTTSQPVQMGYFTGFYKGKDYGVNVGINIGETKQINMSWIQQIFKAIGGVLSIQIFPGVTIGIIVGIPFIISLAWFIIRAFRGGGGA